MGKAIILLMFFTISALGQTWHPGVPGGIPFYPNSVIVPPSGRDDTLAIQLAVNSASNFTAVSLTNGTYYLSGPVVFPLYKVLRGIGSNTVVTTSNGPNFWIYQSPGYGFEVDILDTNLAVTKGSTHFQLTNNPTGLFVGSKVQIQQSNSAAVVTGLEGDSGQWAQGQFVLVTAINGTNYTFDPPLYAVYSNSLVPRIRYTFWVSSNNMVDLAGVENLTVSNLDANSQSEIDMHLCYRCWVKGVELINCGGRHIWTHDTFRCEIDDNSIHNVLPPVLSSRGYGIEIGDPGGTSPPLPCTKSSDLLIQDNIFSANRGDVICGNGAEGCVIAYNYFRVGTNEMPTIQSVNMSVHSSFPVFNLFEGNFGYYANPDIFHGAGDSTTFFRNNILGYSIGKLTQLSCIEIDAEHHNCVVMGNVLGYPNVSNDLVAAGRTMKYATGTPTNCPTIQYNILMWGFDGSGAGTSYNDTNVLLTARVTGNYDFLSNTTAWTNGVQPLSNSLYLASQPVWWTNWGVTPWPPIGPDVATLTNLLPAMLRFNAVLPPTFPALYPLGNIAGGKNLN